MTTELTQREIHKKEVAKAYYERTKHIRQSTEFKDRRKGTNSKYRANNKDRCNKLALASYHKNAEYYKAKNMLRYYTKKKAKDVAGLVLVRGGSPGDAIGLENAIKRSSDKLDEIERRLQSISDAV